MRAWTGSWLPTWRGGRRKVSGSVHFVLSVACVKEDGLHAHVYTPRAGIGASLSRGGDLLSMLLAESEKNPKGFTSKVSPKRRAGESNDCDVCLGIYIYH
jgi:hypothetical protein